MSVALKAPAAAEATIDQRFQRLFSEEKCAEAEPVAQERIEEALRIHGPYHRDTAWALGDLAETYAKQGKHADAEQAYRRALASSEKALGVDHPLTGEFLADLADAWTLQDRGPEAEELYRRAIAVQDRATAMILIRLAAVHREQNEFAEARALLERALKIFEESLGTTNTTTNRCRDLLTEVDMARTSAEVQGRRYSPIHDAGPDVPPPRMRLPVRREEPTNQFEGEPATDVEPTPPPAVEE